MLLYKDLIKQEEEYQYSANIQFDITDERKLLKYIPNETSVELFREFFVDTIKPISMNHARILYGSYGTGKSHFLTVLSMLLGKENVRGIAFDTFINRIRNQDENLANDIEVYAKNDLQKPMLVVPIVFGFEDFDRCIYFSLKKKLDAIGIKVNFKTFYDNALMLISQWKKDSESRNRLLTISDELGINLEKLETQLNNFDKKSEKVFNDIFFKMTYGVEYVYEVTNLIESLKQVNQVISDRYSGIVFVFDEFGRYIEDNLRKIKVKSIQDFAEYCDHSGEKNYIFLVSHKEISQYTGNIGENLSNEWKKVEGRYKATPINDKQDQCLSLIRNIIIKEPKIWEAFKEKHSAKLNRIYSEAIEFKGFLLEANYAGNPFEGAFPMHPIALYALDKLSKKVAQNERTFFTYLASREEKSLYDFLNRHSIEEFHFVGLNDIYDYFEVNIKSLQSDTSYEWYRSLQAALSKIGSDASERKIEEKLLKAIAVIGVINDTNALKADKTTLLSVVDEEKSILDKTLEDLIVKRIVKYSRVYDRYEFFESSSFDVDKLIDEESLSVSEDNIIATLNNEFVNFVLYPYEYNREYKINRVFVPEYASMADASKKLSSKKYTYYDGRILMLLTDENVSNNEILEKSKDMPRSIICINKNAENIKYFTKRYIGVKYLESQKEKYVKVDPVFERELSYFKNEIFLSILSEISEWKNNIAEHTQVVVNGVEVSNIKSFSELSKIASEIMYAHFPNTLIVNNELINKNVTTGSMNTARKNVVKAILSGGDPQEYFGLNLLSPEYIIVRSVLVKNGFIESSAVQNKTKALFRPQEKVLNEIEDFINRAKEEEISFSDLISVLKAPPYGMREGYLSVLLAFKLYPYIKDIIINSNSIEKEIDFEIFEDIVRKPEEYKLNIVSWSAEQEDFLKMIEIQFERYINRALFVRNRLKALYEAMMSHYRNVSKFSRTTDKYISKETVAYRKILERSYSNYTSFFFESLFEIGETYSEVIKAVSSSKIELETAINNLSEDVAFKLKKVLGESDVPLNKLLVDKYTKDWQEKKKKSFDYYTNAVLDYLSKLSNESTDFEMISKLSKIITGFDLVYWSDSHVDDFIIKFDEINKKLEAYEVTPELSAKESKLTLTTSSGDEKTIIFDREEMSIISQTVKNKIKATFDNYGLAITHSDKTQILLALLEELTEGE